MKVWKLVFGILCIVFCLIVIFQSCAAGVVNALEENKKDTSDVGGILLAVLMLAGGIVAIATRKGGKGGNIAIIVLFGLAAIIGFSNAGTYGDLVVWSIWCVLCVVMGVVGLVVEGAKKKPSEKNE